MREKLIVPKYMYNNISKSFLEKREMEEFGALIGNKAYTAKVVRTKINNERAKFDKARLKSQKLHTNIVKKRLKDIGID